MNNGQPQYRFDDDGAFTISDYNLAEPFSSFLPGIAGPWGIPMWAFYVNRGQGICSFGLRDKDHPIAEFLSANWAYQLAFRQGFQTFLKVARGGPALNHEPFQVYAGNGAAPKQLMEIRPEELAFRESDSPAGLDVEVRYFTLPDEELAALVRTITVKNASDKPASVQMLDGLAVMIPYGLNNFSIKEMRYIAQSHAEVIGLAERTPGFRTKATTADSTVVEKIAGVNFCFGYEAGAPDRLLQPIVDPSIAYGPSTDLSRPVRFLQAESFQPTGGQMTENQIPSGLLLAEFKLTPGESRTFHMFYGCAPNPDSLTRFAQRARDTRYVDQRRARNRALIEQITQGCATRSSHRAFDAYARQNLLDNVLRGGIPTTIGNGANPLVLSLYTRKHGDIERDYNYYIIEPTHFSQGEGNFRDVNQNRRHDVFMNPDVGASNVVSFMNLIQADGFNPLLVQPRKLICRDTPALRSLLRRAVGRHARRVLDLVTHEFELGRVLADLAARRIEIRIGRDAFVAELIRGAGTTDGAEYGHGYWSDHWTYNLDLIDSFRAVFPEQWADLLFARKDFVYADSHVFVKPRSRKYVLLNGVPSQHDSLERDAAKDALIRSRKERPLAMRVSHGRGAVYTSRLAPRLLALAAVKLASLDPFGMGIEMESDRPNWYDALNGLPGRFGSSLSETFELKRLLSLIRESLDLAPRPFAWTLPVEVHAFIAGLQRALRRARGGSRQKGAFRFWDEASSLKESFRERIRMGFAGPEKALNAKQVREFVEAALDRVEAGIAAARDRKTGLFHTYFRHEVAKYKPGPVVGGNRTFKALHFKQFKLPLFLEGQVHALRLERDIRKASRLARAVRQSGLFDKTLNMYKVNADLSREPISIGRARTFARGWLENESVWLHMEYKYLLEMLRSGLHQEFFEDLRHCAIPFLNPETYGRSTTENSSFLVSDVYPEKSQVGRGFMARLSGATAEFIHMWMLMCAGERPFRLDAENRLEAALRPILPSWLFTSAPGRLELTAPDGKPVAHDIPPCSFAFLFLRHTLVTYSQRGPCRNTFGPRGATIQSMRLTYDDGATAEIAGAVIPAPHAEALRNRRIRSIEALLG